MTDDINDTAIKTEAADPADALIKSTQEWDSFVLAAELARARVASDAFFDPQPSA
ncbi:MAG TPA: hypothetical protein VGG02_13870 [Chthoniobacterales bacterium]|jgi:hypothetical protein